MLVTDPVSGEVLPVRRLTLALKEPTRDGDTELQRYFHDRVLQRLDPPRLGQPPDEQYPESGHG